jgi:hypothetical protein
METTYAKGPPRRCRLIGGAQLLYAKGQRGELDTQKGRGGMEGESEYKLRRKSEPTLDQAGLSGERHREK